ncbi:hypothetical protein JW877_04235 [bacterium]|nr:hypothetical protein [bacterium]
MNYKYNNLLILIRDHLKKYPRMKVVDIYKMLYQATMGGKHLILQPSAYECFQNEYMKIEPREGIIFEQIHPDQEISRIHLDTCKYYKADPEMIWKYIKSSADEFSGDEQKLRSWWQFFNYLVDQKELQFSSESTIRINQIVGEKGFIPLHHSDEFRQHYNPSYRLITSKYRLELLKLLT